MAYEIPVLQFTLIAASDLSAKQFYGVTVNGSGQAAVAGVGTQVAGVIQNNPTSGNETTIMALGVTKMIAGGTIAAGANVGVDASGRAKALTLGAGSGTSMIGIALTGGVLNDILTVLLLPAGAQPTTPA